MRGGALDAPVESVDNRQVEPEQSRLVGTGIEVAVESGDTSGVGGDEVGEQANPRPVVGELDAAVPMGYPQVGQTRGGGAVPGRGHGRTS